MSHFKSSSSLGAVARRSRGAILLLRVAAAVAAVVLFTPSTASADALRLRSGETLRGRMISEKSDERHIVWEDYLSGVVREFTWDALDPRDAELYGDPILGSRQGDNSVPCENIDYRLDNGSITRIVGSVEREDDKSIFVKNASQKDAFPIEKKRIVGREKDFCDPLVIQSSEQWAAEKKGEMNPQDARSWYQFGIYCETVYAYREGKEAYEQAAMDETFLNRKSAQEGVKRCEQAIQDKDALDEILVARNQLTANAWKAVRDRIEGFAAKHPTVGEAITKKLETLKADFAKRRTVFFSALAGRRLEPLMREAIRKRVAPKDAELGSVAGWLKKDGIDEVWGSLLLEMQKGDPAITPDETKTLFEGRPKKVWRRARYGSGSRWVEQPKFLPKTGSRAPQQPKRGSSSGAPPTVIKVPDPPNKEDWWRDLPVEQRVDFCWASFVEKSGLFEVEQKKDRTACDKCNGDGTITATMSDGTQIVYLCPRCGGLRVDLFVKYR